MRHADDLGTGRDDHAGGQALVGFGARCHCTTGQRCRRFRRQTRLAALDLAPAGDVGQMLLIGAGKGVAARAVGDKEQVFSPQGVQDGGDGASPGLAMGVGGRPSMR